MIGGKGSREGAIRGLYTIQQVRTDCLGGDWELIERGFLLSPMGMLKRPQYGKNTGFEILEVRLRGIGCPEGRESRLEQGSNLTQCAGRKAHTIYSCMREVPLR